MWPWRRAELAAEVPYNADEISIGLIAALLRRDPNGWHLRENVSLKYGEPLVTMTYDRDSRSRCRAYNIYVSKEFLKISNVRAELLVDLNAAVTQHVQRAVGSGDSERALRQLKLLTAAADRLLEPRGTQPECSATLN